MKEEISPLQAMMNGMSDQWQKDRAQDQMTLGKLIERLKEIPPETEIESLSSPHSYRGYYCDLSFERGEPARMTAGEALRTCQKCMGEVFEGYKGGDFQMGRNTPVWIASYGCCGKKIMALRDDGTFELAEDE